MLWTKPGCILLPVRTCHTALKKQNQKPQAGLAVTATVPPRSHFWKNGKKEFNALLSHLGSREALLGPTSSAEGKCITCSLMGHQTWVSNFSSLFVSSLQFAFNKSFSFKINCSIAVFTHAQEIKTCYKSNLCTPLATVPVEYASLDTHAESICTCLIWVLLNSARNSCKVFHYFFPPGEKLHQNGHLHQAGWGRYH